jgi:hypothetical protein
MGAIEPLLALSLHQPFKSPPAIAPRPLTASLILFFAALITGP